ncbi:MAG: tyrosine-type recombinase/integrase [Faecalibacterium sp.]|nr:tyrosine-type recombinase/integrase [Faecalibacterium sp.]
MDHWLKHISHNLQVQTVLSHQRMITASIRPFFDARQVTLLSLRPQDIEDFYDTFYERGCKGTTVIRYHQILKQALSAAVRKDLLPANPMDKVDRPKKAAFERQHYSEEEVQKLIQIFADDPMRIPVTLTAFYGFRRSEVLGLKWENIDFENRTISVQHKVLAMPGTSRTELIVSDQLKTISSRRTLPLIPAAEALLKDERARQAENRKAFRKGYNTRYLDMICVNELGQLISPDCLSQHFWLILEKNGMRHIRFHDLRHTCASLLLSQHVDIKYIQHWLGHSNYSTTADIYAHLATGAGEETAQAMIHALGLDKKEVRQPTLTDSLPDSGGE